MGITGKEGEVKVEGGREGGREERGIERWKERGKKNELSCYLDQL